MYYLTKEGVNFLNEAPIYDDEGNVVQTQINPRFRNVLQHGEHSRKLVNKSLASADAKRAKLEKGAKKVHISKANKQVRRAFAKKFFPHGGKSPDVLPGMMSNRPAAEGEKRDPGTILTLKNEGFMDWLKRKKKPSEPIKLPKRSSAADRGQGKKTGKGESSLGDQATEIDNTKANKKAIDDVFGESKESLDASRPDFKKFLRDLGDRRRQRNVTRKKIPQNLKGKALADALRQKDIEGLGFRGPEGRG
tara:strand:- start:44 stop:790 length:747 start_codon:yes stop_codon:yes gene_type:complete